MQRKREWSHDRDNYNMENVIKGAVLGHVIGDVLGLPVEFYPRKRLTENPVDRMLSYGAHHMPMGTWSDDSSMMLCTIASIVEQQRIDFENVMLYFSRWAKDGYMTPYGKSFGIGRTTLKALGKFWRGEEAVSCGCATEKDNGNGSLMRILPIVLYNAMAEPVPPLERRIRDIHSVSALTHSHSRTEIACGIYMFVLEEILRGKNKLSVHVGLQKAREHYKNCIEIHAYERIFEAGFPNLPQDEIKSSGYIVDTIEAAVWCVLNTDCYSSCVLKAVNLGGDTDTIAAVAGGLAGAIYTFDGLPEEWLDCIVRKGDILQICDDFKNGICAGRAYQRMLETSFAL